MELFLFWYRLLGNAWRADVGEASLYFIGVLLLMFVALVPWLLLTGVIERRLLSADYSSSLRWLVRVSLSLGLVGVSSMLLGIGGLLERVWLWAAYAAILVTALLTAVYWRRRRTSIWRFPQWNNSVPGLLLIVSTLLVVPALIYHAAVFPILSWDSMHYDAPLARTLYFNGEFPETVGRSLGFGMDTGYPPIHWAIAAYFYVFLDTPDDIFLRLLSPAGFLLIVWASYEIGRLWGGKRLAALCALMAMFTPLVAFGAYRSNYNMLLGGWVALALLFVLRAERSGDRREWLLAGWFIGLAGLTSFNGYYPAVALVVVAFVSGITQTRKRSTSRRWSNLRGPLVMALLAFALNVPWWARNIETFGTPVQPFLSPDPFVSEINEQRLRQNLGNLHRNVLRVGQNPSPANWMKFYFLHSSGLPSVSLLALLGIPIALRRPRAAVYLIALAATFWLSPILQPAQTERHAISYIGALSTLAALVMNEVLGRPRHPWLRAVSFVVLTVLLWGNLSPVIALGHRFRPFGGSRQTAWSWSQEPERWSKSAVLRSEYGGWVPSWNYLNERLLPGARVAVIGVPNYYIADGDAARLLYLDSKEALPLHGVAEAEEIREFFKANNVQFIYARNMNRYRFAYKGIEVFKLLGSSDFPEVAPSVFVVP